jgi:uncharacterized protein YdhG (YjbR/CyaY superfamily)
VNEKLKTIDDYLAAVSEDKRAALERLRKIIKTAAPKAEECISYQLAAFRLNGSPLSSGHAAAGCTGAEAGQGTDQGERAAS